MDVREKLVELICRFCSGLVVSDITPPYGYENLADYLISNGVTVQEWISAKDHTPKEKGCYLIAGNHWWDGKPVAREAFWNGDDWLSCYDKGNISRRVTHWMPLPKPPKEGVEG